MSTITYQAEVADLKPTSANEKSIPTYIYAVVFASFCIVAGLIWDISWHMSIGRDGLFSPPHLATYLGSVVAGFFSGYHVLKVTITGTKKEKEGSIKFWGIFYGSLGALFCIWGAFAIITSAPFDDWWHSAFGLDVQILSPPHTVFLGGMIVIQFGAMVSVMSLKNQPRSSILYNKRVLDWCFALSAGFLLVILFTISSEYLSRHDMHRSRFYVVSATLFPLFIVSMSKASNLKWGGTYVTLVYMLFLAALVWILPLFPAEPKLGPVYNHITHYQNFHFPLLLVFPAIAIDFINRKINIQPFLKAILIGTSFVLIQFLVQWPFGSFLASPYARNWFFGSTSWYFGSDPDAVYRYAFPAENVSALKQMVFGLGVAIFIGTLSSWLGLAWGNWLKSIKR